MGMEQDLEFAVQYMQTALEKFEASYDNQDSEFIFIKGAMLHTLYIMQKIHSKTLPCNNEFAEIPAEKPQLADEKAYSYYTYKNAVLRYHDEEGFVLLKGSRITIANTSSTPEVSKRIRQALMSKSLIMHEYGNECYFDSDIVLNDLNQGKQVSISAAASVISAYSVSGIKVMACVHKNLAMSRLKALQSSVGMC